ncbi:MAG: 30S ribosomal protein S16 [Paludibacteraceae bacterium]|nr:30S ribosomal protein S16 [Paludibacteraceae bacterium]
MATKIRLQRNGRKGYAYYHIVIADVRSPRDGRIIERIGSYNPNVNPAAVDLKFDRALYWVETGAQPTDTVRNILSREGVMMMKHLNGGVRKGAFTEEEAQKRFESWKAEKAKTLEGIVAKAKTAKNEARNARLEAEKAVNKAKAEEIARKKAEALAAEEAAAKAAAEEAAAQAAETEQTEEKPAEA